MLQKVRYVIFLTFIGALNVVHSPVIFKHQALTYKWHLSLAWRYKDTSGDLDVSKKCTKYTAYNMHLQFEILPYFLDRFQVLQAPLFFRRKFCGRCSMSKVQIN